MSEGLTLPDGEGGWRSGGDPRQILAGGIPTDPVSYYTTADCYVVRIPVTLRVESAFDTHMPFRDYYVREHGGNAALQAAASLVNIWEKKHARVAPTAEYPKAQAGNWLVIKITYREYREAYRNVSRWPYEIALPAGCESRWPQGEVPPMFTFWTDTAEHSGEYAGESMIQVGADGVSRPATSNELPEVEVDL